jgi:hypothetical protein
VNKSSQSVYSYAAVLPAAALVCAGAAVNKPRYATSPNLTTSGVLSVHSAMCATTSTKYSTYNSKDGAPSGVDAIGLTALTAPSAVDQTGGMVSVRLLSEVCATALLTSGALAIFGNDASGTMGHAALIVAGLAGYLATKGKAQAR